MGASETEGEEIVGDRKYLVTVKLIGLVGDEKPINYSSFYKFIIKRDCKVVSRTNIVRCDGIQAINLERYLLDQYCRENNIKNVIDYKCIMDKQDFAVEFIDFKDISDIKFS